MVFRQDANAGLVPRQRPPSATAHLTEHFELVPHIRNVTLGPELVGACSAALVPRSPAGDAHSGAAVMSDGGPHFSKPDVRSLPMEMDHGSRHFTLANRHSAANYHSAVALLALADMSQPDSQRGETNAPDVAEKREHGVLNSAARVRQILGPAIAARL